MDQSRRHLFRATAVAACALAALASLAGCVTTAPPRPAIVSTKPHAVSAPPDWFHRELALARHARLTHLPHTDKAGAQAAYYAVMVPACARVVKSGPAKYRARCATLVEHATSPAPQIMDEFPCNTDHDDSRDTPEEMTACND